MLGAIDDQFAHGWFGRRRAVAVRRMGEEVADDGEAGGTAVDWHDGQQRPAASRE
jgi:hypothetical protein